MKSNATSDSILLAGKRILIAQAGFGLLFVAYQLFFKNGLYATSALVGVLIAIFPALIGSVFASIKSRLKPEKSLRDLMRLSRNIKIIYTILMFVLTFRFTTLHDSVVLIAFSLTMLGNFFAPMFRDQIERKA